MRSRIFVATETGRELTSNYIADHVAAFRYSTDSPLLAAAAWRKVVEQCSGPVVFVTRNGDRDARQALAALPLLYEDGHYAAYGPCRRRGGGEGAP